MKKQDLEYGRLVSQNFEQEIPLTVDEFWSGFDDYLSLQKSLSGHAGLKLSTGDGRPNNGVGAEVTFSFAGGQTHEVLWQKDDTNKIWVMGIPQPNAYFSYYRATVSVWQVKDTTRAKLTIDAVLASQKQDQRQQVLNTMDQIIPTRLKEICDLILNRDGLRMSLKLDINYDIDEFWQIVSNWDDISWVMGSTGVQALGENVRRINFGAISLDEKLDSATSQDYTLVYSIIRSEMPVSMYTGTLCLTSDQANKTTLHYDSIFLPRTELDPQAVKQGIEQGFAKRLHWLEKTFNQHTPVQQ